MPKMENIVIDGLTIMEEGAAAADADYIQVFLPVERLALKDITVLRSNQEKPAGHLVAMKDKGAVKQLLMRDVAATGFASLIDGEEAVQSLQVINVSNQK